MGENKTYRPKVSKTQRLIRRFRIFLSFIPPFFRHLFYYPAGKLRYRKRNIWLFSERGTDARDNGYHMYRYVRENHQEIEAYYVIEKNSPDREKLVPYGNLVDYGSFKHRMLFYGAKIIVSTHVLTGAPDHQFHYYVRRRLEKDIIGNKMVFLQHGVTKDDIPALYQEKTLLDLFICGAKPEYDYISSHFHYKNNEVRYTGFARYDSLADNEPKRQILIMPTWRSWLKNSSDKQFAESEYAVCWKDVLDSDALKKFAREYGYKIMFYPHYEMQKHISFFSSDDENIIMADFANYDVQTLLKESALLITDYSSVFFDFAYMNKPMIFYQFDEDGFFEEHYNRGYFDYRRDGFGEVVTSRDELLKTLREYLETDCEIKPMYSERIKGFFPLHDTNNCRRIYEEIINL